MPIHPDRTAEEIVPHLSTQRLDHLPRPLELVRDHVNDDVRIEPRNPGAESAFCLFGPAVHHNLFDGLPGGMWPVGCRGTAADIYNLVSTLDKGGHEIASDMSAPSNDDDPSHSIVTALSTFHSTNRTTANCVVQKECS